MPSKSIESQQPVRIAIVEDDDTLRDRVLSPILRRHGYEVSGFATATALYNQMGVVNPHIIVLDIGLPDESGFAVARRLRADSHVGIVMLTGLREVPDHVRGLSNGADAYLSKPVTEELLLATLQSLQRRMSAPPNQGGTGHWRLSADAWRLYAPDGASMDLFLAEREVLAELFAHAGTPVAREALIARLTEGESEQFDPHRLEMIVHRLRRRVTSALGTELPVRAVRGFGYLFTALDS